MISKEKLIKILKFWLPVLLWMGIIFIFSSYPTSRASEVHWEDFIVKKTAHIIEYGFLATLVYRAFINNGVNKQKASYYAILVAAFYGFTDELHQSFTPGREPTLRDVIFDTLGAISAVYLVLRYLPKAPERVRSWAKKLEME
jgi:VanZ family protein